jgi:perosamine synthetase
MIRLFRPSYDQSELSAVAEVLESGWTGLGPKTALFESSFATFCSTGFCVGLSSGTAAIQTALKLLQVGQGDEVIVPAMTFVSAAHCVSNSGATPVFSDVLPGTLNIDPRHAGELVTDRTRAVIPVHLAGYPADMDALRGSMKGVPVIEDCAHAAGSLYKGRPAGSIGEIGCFSFHAVKNLSMGEGGAIVTDNGDFAQRAKKLRWLGIDRDTWDRSSMDRDYWWEYQVNEIGMNCRMDDIHAAIGLVQLKKLESANSRRREIAGLYDAGLGDLQEVTLPPRENGDFVSSWHMYRIEVERRDDLNVFMSESGICTGVHYKPLHLYSCYGRRQSLPVAENAFGRILSLPMYPDLTDEQVSLIIDSIRKFCNG